MREGEQKIILINSAMLSSAKNMIRIEKQKKTSDKKFYPGYLLVKTQLNEESWHFLRNIPKVIGFVGGKVKDGKLIVESVPTVEESEINKMRNKIEEGTLKPTPKVIFDKGESVKVIEGPFSSFNGMVEEEYEERGRLCK